MFLPKIPWRPLHHPGRERDLLLTDDFSADLELTPVYVRKRDLIVQKVWLFRRMGNLPAKFIVRFSDRRTHERLFTDQFKWSGRSRRIKTRMFLTSLGLDLSKGPILINPLDLRGRYTRAIVFCYRLGKKTLYRPIAYETPEQPGSAVDDIRLLLFPPPHA
jgi:hypothetical protein